MKRSSMKSFSASTSMRSHPRSGFTVDEDCLLADLVIQYGENNWTTISSFMEKRNPRQCKDRYLSYLSPNINKEPYSCEEDDLLRQKYDEIGPKWVKISRFFVNRTDISVKCRWAVLNRKDAKLKKNKKYQKIRKDSTKNNESPTRLQKQQKIQANENLSPEDLNQVENNFYNKNLMAIDDNTPSFSYKELCAPMCNAHSQQTYQTEPQEITSPSIGAIEFINSPQSPENRMKIVEANNNHYNENNILKSSTINEFLLEEEDWFGWESIWDLACNESKQRLNQTMLM